MTMKAVNAHKAWPLETLVTHKPMLLLNLSRYSIWFVDSIVRRSPWLIASRGGGKKLPLELWYMILDAVRENTEERDKFTLVWPRCLQTSDDNGASNDQVLVCGEYMQRFHCGHFEQLEDIAKVLLGFQQFLDNPDSQEEEVLIFPHPLPVLTGRAFTIDAKLLRETSTPAFLYKSLDVADIVAWLHNGECRFCGGTRYAGTGNHGSSLDGMFGTRVKGHYHVPCPVCIGRSVTAEYLEEMFALEFQVGEAVKLFLEEIDNLDLALLEHQERLGYL
jgi:hypothetical protein